MMLETASASIFALSFSTQSQFSMRRAAAAPPYIPPSPSTGADPKQTVAESYVPSTQTGFSVKESAAQYEFILCCEELRTNGAWDSRREREERFLNLRPLIHIVFKVY